MDERKDKPQYFRNEVKVENTGINIPKGKKRLWIPKHRFWVDVPIDEPDEEAIERVTKKYNAKTNFENNGESKSKDLF